MKVHELARAHALAWATGLALLALPVAAQQAPLTGRMLAPRTHADTVARQGDTTTAPEPARTPVRIGDATRALLDMQVRGDHAAAPLPMLGDEAGAAYRRYIQSFAHPIPAFFEQRVREPSDGGYGSR